MDFKLFVFRPSQHDEVEAQPAEVHSNAAVICAPHERLERARQKQLHVTTAL